MKKTNAYFWAWILGASALVLLVIFMLPAVISDSNPVTPGIIVGEGGGPGPSVPISNLKILTTSPNQKSLVGSQVNLADVKIVDQLNSRVFWIAPLSSPNDKVLVLLESNTPNNNSIQNGGLVSFTGNIQAIPSKDTLTGVWGLSGDQAGSISFEQVYIITPQVNTILENNKQDVTYF